jgi:predicted RND superfamily exporter protein
VAGNPVVMVATQEFMFRDMGRFTALSIVALAALLGVTLRRASGVIVPLIVVVLTLASTIGMMALSGRPITFITQVVPSFVLAVGVGFSVHVLAIFYQRLDQGDDEHDAITGALRHSGPAIVMSALTTAGGMSSFLASTLIPVRDLGFFIPFGVLLASAFSLTLVPALLRLLRVRRRETAARSGVPPTERILEHCARFGVRHARGVALACVPLLIVTVAGIPRITRDYNPVEWLPKGSAARDSTDFVDLYMGGATNLELVIDAREDEALYDPAMLGRIEAIQRHVEVAASGQISKTVSLVDVAKEIHQALNRGDPEKYAIPESRRLVAQEMLLFESAGSDDLEDVTDTGFQLARITLKGRQENTSQYSAFLEKHRPEFERLSEGRDVMMTGAMVIGTHVADLTVVTALRSYAIAFLLITPLMILFIGRLRIGLISMVPNLSPILMVVGFMGWAGIPLDVFTVLVAGIALGLVVDDTLHILNGFGREYWKTGHVEEAIVSTVRTTGRALLFTTLVLTTAFSIYGFSGAISIQTFGLLTAFAVTLAFVFDLFLSPALLALVYRDREQGE